MQAKTPKLLLILLCAAPLALVACQHHEHPGDSAPANSGADEHPGDGSANDSADDAAGSEHPGDK